MALHYAILGVCRLGATRLGYHSGQLLCQIGKRLLPARLGIARLGAATLGLLTGADRLRNLEKASLRIEETGLTDIPTATFSFKAPIAERPQPGEIVIIAIGTLRQRLFLGRLTVPDEGRKVGARYVYQCEAVGLARDLQRRKVFATYAGYSAKEILELLFAAYTSGDFYLGPDIRNGADIEEITFNGESLLDACNELAGRSGYVFYVDALKHVHFRPASEHTAPWSVADGERFADLHVVPDTSQTKNRIYVQYSELVLQSQTFSGDGERTEFYLSEAIHSVLSLTVDGSPVTYGIRYQEDNSGNDFAIHYDEKYITNSAHATLTSGQVLAISYYGKVPKRLEVNTLVSQRECADIEGGDGIYEHFEEDLEIVSQADALAKAEDLLAKYAQVAYRASYMRKDYVFGYFQNLLRVGMIQTITAREWDLALAIDKITLSIWNHQHDARLGIRQDVTLSDHKEGLLQIFQSLLQTTPVEAQLTATVNIEEA